LAAEKKNTNVLLDDENFFSDKIYKLYEWVVLQVLTKCSEFGLGISANLTKT
jgi:hypothetical protein